MLCNTTLTVNNSWWNIQFLISFSKANFLSQTDNAEQSHAVILKHYSYVTFGARQWESLFHRIRKPDLCLCQPGNKNRKEAADKIKPSKPLGMSGHVGDPDLNQIRLHALMHHIDNNNFCEFLKDRWTLENVKVMFLTGNTIMMFAKLVMFGLDIIIWRICVCLLVVWYNMACSFVPSVFRPLSLLSCC